MLVTLQENLKKADEGNYAVGQFNCPTLEAARAAVEVAEELKAPIILAHAEVHDEIVPIEIIGPILVNLAKNASIPITVHLDHGTNISMVRKAIDIGFSSVMIDASIMSYEDNINTVKEVVDYAHRHNVSVEAELGVMTSSGIGGEDTGGNHLGELYTDPDIAKDFVEQTDIDALAAAFGTVHGIYVQEPNLDYDRLRKIHDNIQRPVVMHGGSGLSEEEYINAIDNGVRKINYYSYAAKAAGDAVKEYVNQNKNVFYHDVTIVALEALKKDYKKAISTFTLKEIS